MSVIHLFIHSSKLLKKNCLIQEQKQVTIESVTQLICPNTDSLNYKTEKKCKTWLNKDWLTEWMKQPYVAWRCATLVPNEVKAESNSIGEAKIHIVNIMF